MNSLKDMVKDGKKVYFQFYRNKILYYKTECGFMFEVPISDTGDACFNAEDKAMLFMRWIRRAIANIEGIKDPAKTSKIAEELAYKNTLL